MSGLLLGLDVGTTATKCVLLDPGRMGTGEFRSWDAVAGLTTVAGLTEPDPRTDGRYAELYAVYRSLYPALLEQQHTLARLSRTAGGQLP